MPKRAFLYLLATCFFSFLVAYARAQQVPTNESDTFFLAKKKGLFGRLGRSISLSPPGPVPVKVANPYLKFAGKAIRNIRFAILDFDRNIYDSTDIQNNFGIRVAKVFHKPTWTST